jgi:hypothetical protein
MIVEVSMRFIILMSALVIAHQNLVKFSSNLSALISVILVVALFADIAEFIHKMRD